MSSAQCLLKTRQIIFASDAPFVMLLAAAAHSFCACSTLFCYKSGPFVLFLSPSFAQIHFFPILIYWSPFFKSFLRFLVCFFFLPSECVKNSVTLFFFFTWMWDREWLFFTNFQVVPCWECSPQMNRISVKEHTVLWYSDLDNGFRFYWPILGQRFCDYRNQRALSS